MLGSLILYLKGMRRMMFQLSGFYCKEVGSAKTLETQAFQPKPYSIEAVELSARNLWPSVSHPKG